MGNPVKVSAINLQQYLTHSAKTDSIIANEKTYSEVIRDMVRKQIRFRGKVQGVGFRYHAKSGIIIRSTGGFAMKVTVRYIWKFRAKMYW